MNPHLLVALQGGGSYGSYQAGMLEEYFAQGGQPYDGGYGVSVGALNVAQLFGTKSGSYDDAMKQQPENAKQLAELWRTEISGDDSVYKPHRSSGVVTEGARRILGNNIFGDMAVATLRKKPAVYDTTPLRKLLERNLSGKKWPRAVEVGTVSLELGRFFEIPLHKPLEGLTAIDAIMASAAIPIVFPPIEGFVDGGVTDVTPLRSLFQHFRDVREERAVRSQPTIKQELHVMRASSFPVPKAGPFDRVTKVLERTLQIFVDNTDREDFERVAFINELANKMHCTQRSDDPRVKDEFVAWHEKYAVIDTYVIGPSKAEMGKFSESARSFSRTAIREGLRLGRQRMADFLKHKEDYLLEVVLFQDDVPELPR
jgi:predicted acylesterase/phospholipase RssA